MITVIIPYWNAMPWIERCCESLHAQDGNFEFIMVDDGSTDESAETAKRYADDSRFVFLTNKHAKGVSGARNTGLDNSRGKFVTFLDADDEMLPDAYRKYRDLIRSAPRANIYQMNHRREHSTVHRFMNEGGWYSLPDLPSTWWGVWNTLYRAEFIKDIRFDEGIQYGEDGLFNLKCLAKDGRIYHGDRSLTAVNHRFDNKESLSHSKKAEDILKQVRTYEDFLMRQTDPELRVFICKELSRLWNKKTIERLFREI